MNIVVGLGNPGAEYNFTRHNFGFLALDFYLKKHGFAWSKKSEFGAIIYRSQDFMFVKPQNFYNNSGETVQNFLHYYKITPENLLVVCDDLALPFGTIRLRHSGASGGNNGLKSITTHLGTQNFTRLRLGTKNDLLASISDQNFVLGKFTDLEKTQLPPILTAAAQHITDWLQNSP